MDNDSTLANEPPTSYEDSGRQQLAAYNLLVRQSRKLGNFATKTYQATKDFLKKDVSTLHPDVLLFGSKTTEDEPQAEKTEPEKSDKLVETMPGIYATPPANTLDNRDSLQGIVRKSHQVLAAARTVILPNNLFPDSVIVDRTKVTILKRSFFWTSSVISIRIEDVLNVTCGMGPLFGSLTLSSRVMNSTDHYEINYFWRKDAAYLKQIIQGYVIAQHNHIQTAHLEKEELTNTLLELGRDSDF